MSHPSWKITAFDNLSRRGAEHNLQRFDEIGIQFVHGDIRNPEDLDGISNFDVMIDASANPSVIVGIDSSPLQALNTNLMGTVNCLEACLRNKASLLFLSTSRVYPFGLIDAANFDELDTRYTFSGDQQLSGLSSVGISEQFPLSGARSFYGTAKLASEFLITEYRTFKGLKAVINRCGIIAGPGQFGKVDQGIVTYWMACHLLKKDLKYIGYGGKGKQLRDLIHIADLVRLIDVQIQDIDHFDGKTMNVGGGLGRSLSLMELTGHCQEVTGNKVNIGSVEETRAADVRIYVSDSTYLNSTAGAAWQLERTTMDILADTFDWVRENENLFKKLIE
jgi:CDP-paratose 2-epimerase